jgi:hypothetical protein
MSAAVAAVKIDGHPGLLAKEDGKNQARVAEMLEIALTISEGAMSFLLAEYAVARLCCSRRHATELHVLAA